MQNYLNDLRRQCERYCDAQESCDTCNICHGDEICLISIIPQIKSSPEEMIGEVMKWAKEHPETDAKTYADDFFEKFPDAHYLMYDGKRIPTIPACRVYFGKQWDAACATVHGMYPFFASHHECFKCWLKEYKQPETNTTGKTEE